MRTFMKIFTVVMFLSIGISLLVIYGKDAMSLMKEPYRIEDANFDQIQVGDRVTLNVVISCGRGASVGYIGSNWRTYVPESAPETERCYLIPFISESGEEVHIDHILPVQVFPDHFQEFDSATEAFFEWLPWKMSDYANIEYYGQDFNTYMNNYYIHQSKRLDIDTLPTTVIYHYDGIIQELPHDIMFSDLMELRDYRMGNYLEQFYLVNAPSKAITYGYVIAGIVLTLLGLIVGIVFMKKR